MPDLSIIVPVYNVEPYLKDTLTSILKQTFDDFELLLIDDGSIDASGQICDQFALKDNRVHVVHQTNAGMSAARNRGLTMATGKYLGFVDSDDLLAPNMYQLLISNLETFDAAISICGMKEIRRGQTVEPYSKQVAQLYDSEAILALILKGKRLSVNIQNRVYKASLFKDVTFPSGKIAEDAAVTTALLCRKNRVVFDETPCYFYLRHGASATTRPFARVDLTSIEVWRANEQLIQATWPRLSGLAHMRVISSNFYVLDKIMLSENWRKIPDQKPIIHFLRSNAAFILKNSEFTRNRKIAVVLLLISPYLYRTIVKLQRRAKRFE